MLDTKLYEIQDKPENYLSASNIDVDDVSSNKQSYIILLKNRHDSKEAKKILQAKGFEVYPVGKLLYIS